MELIERIQNDAALMPYIALECEENEVCAAFDSEVDRARTLIIKVDDYYNNLGLDKTPSSIDCLIIQYCSENKYRLRLIELKNVKTAQSISRKSIEKKYETTLFDFMSNRFRTYFFDENYDLKLKLVLIAGRIKDQQIKAHNLDFLLGLRMYKFQNRRLAVHGTKPHLTIKNCS
jgi:hypothetical protein